MRHFLVIVLMIMATNAFVAQTEGVSIKNSPGAPHPSAMLDIESSTKGVLIPRVNLLSITNNTLPVASPTVGLLVYNLTSSVSGGAGYFYWNGAAWAKLVTGYNGELWSKISVSGSPTSHIEYFSGNVRIGNAAGSAAPDYDLEVKSGTSNAYTCLFESNGTQLHWGYNDYNGETGGGPGNWLTQKTAAVTSTQCTTHFLPMRYVQLYETGDWGFGVTSWGKCQNTMGFTSMGTTKNGLELSVPSNANLELKGGVVKVISGSCIAMFSPTAGNFVVTSDSTLKKNITNETSVISRIAGCRPVTYNFKGDGSNRLQHGLIAQEVVSVFPELVFDIEKENKAEDGSPLGTTTVKKGVSYDGLISVLLKAIQEQQVMIDDLKDRVYALEH